MDKTKKGKGKEKKTKVKSKEVHMSSSEEENEPLYADSSEKSPHRSNFSDAKCFYSESLYSMDNRSESWIQCLCCKLWAHEECSGIETVVFSANFVLQSSTKFNSFVFFYFICHGGQYGSFDWWPILPQAILNYHVKFLQMYQLFRKS